MSDRASNAVHGLAVDLNAQRKAAIVNGGAQDHAGRVEVRRMTNFDLGRTIFGGLEGVPRLFMKDKLAKEATWDPSEAATVEAAYTAAEGSDPLPTIDQRLIDFMVEECDFSMEHADGSFLQHLVFCHHYAARHYPEHSPNIALLHSILGTATNTFAMRADKIPQLKAVLSDEEAIQVESFPSILRLLYDVDLLEDLNANIARLDQLAGIECYRVIDNEPLSIDAEQLWVNLNFHLMHFVDFMPTANWGIHRADPLLQMFEALSDLLDRAGQRRARVDVAFPAGKGEAVREERSLVGRVSGLLPADLTMKLARKSIREYSAAIDHDLGYRLHWAA